MGRIRNTLAHLDKKGWAKLLAVTVAAAVLLGVVIASLVNITGTVAEQRAAKREYDSLRDTYAPDAQSIIPGTSEPAPNPAEVNPDYAGWLAVPGAGVDYPVVRGSDNARYLTTTFEGNYNPAGTIFMDYRNAQGFASPHAILYGHNMKDGSMFGSLQKYLDAAYLAENPTITTTAPDGTTATYTIFAARVTDAWDAAYRLDFADDADFASFAAGLGAPEGTTRLLTLSTCTNSEDDTERVLIHAALV